MKNIDLNEAAAIFLDRPIAFHRCLAIVGGGIAEGVFMSQCLYWWQATCRLHPDRKGWFNKDDDAWRGETTLSRHELQAVKKTWIDLKVLRYERRNMRRDSYYNINFRHLVSLIVAECAKEPRYSQVLARTDFQLSGEPETGLRYTETIRNKNLSPLTPLTGAGGTVSGVDLVESSATAGNLQSDPVTETPKNEPQRAQDESQPSGASPKTSKPTAVNSARKTPPPKPGPKPAPRPAAGNGKSLEFNQAVQKVIDTWYEAHRHWKGQKPVDSIARGRAALDRVAESYESLDQFVADSERGVEHFFQSGVASFDLMKLSHHWVALKEAPVLQFLKKKEDEYYA